MQRNFSIQDSDQQSRGYQQQKSYGQISVEDDYYNRSKTDDTCYFCRQSNMNTCVNRSLYHKYSDVNEKYSRDIDRILKKQKFLTRFCFDEIQYEFDETDNFKTYYPEIKTNLEVTELLQYYKYRKFVPIFTKSKNALSITESIYYYYYERLKIYYNDIKRQLNMTIENTSQSENSDESIISHSDRTPSNDMSNLLVGIQPQQKSCQSQKPSIKHYQSQSKALQDVMRLLRKNQDQLKKIKTLKTEDCQFMKDAEHPRPLYQKIKKNPKRNDPFQDHNQNERISFAKNNQKPTISTEANNSHLKLGNVMKINKKMQKNSQNNVFFRYIESIKALKVTEANMKIKMRKKSIESLRTNSQKKKNEHPEYYNNKREKLKDDQYTISQNTVGSNIHTYNSATKRKKMNEQTNQNNNNHEKSKRKIIKSVHKEKSLRKLSDLKEDQLIENIQNQNQIKQLPKILMQFEQRPKRSSSCISIKYSKNLQSSNGLSSKIIPIRRGIETFSPYQKQQKKQLKGEIKKCHSSKQVSQASFKNNQEFYRYKVKREITKNKNKAKSPGNRTPEKYNHYNQCDPTEGEINYYSVTNTNIHSNNINTHQTSSKKAALNSVEISQTDNLASLRRKKIQALKLKSSKKNGHP